MNTAFSVECVGITAYSFSKAIPEITVERLISFKNKTNTMKADEGQNR